MISIEGICAGLTLFLALTCLGRGVNGINFFIIVYPILYFLPTVPPLFDGSNLSEITQQRFAGSSPAMKLQAFLALGFIAIQVARLQEWRNTGGQKIGSLLVILLLIVGLVFEVGIISGTQLINVAGLVIMLLGLTTMANAWQKASAYRWPIESGWCVMALALLFVTAVSVLLAYAEIVQDKTWARFIGSDGRFIKRASAFMFNPNLFALWCCMLTIIFSFIWQSKLLTKYSSLALAGVFLAGLGIFFSSSRSQGYLLILFLTVTAILTPKCQRHRWIPLLIYLASLGFAISTSALNWHFGSKGDIDRDIMALAMRFLNAPTQLIAVSLEQALGIENSTGITLNSETIIAFNGRFYGEGRDAALLTAIDDTGIIGATGLLAFWGYVTYLGVRAYLLQRTVFTAYALALVGFTIGIGVFMRYQVFPVWLFMVLLLSPCIALWRNVLNDRGLSRQNWI